MGIDAEERNLITEPPPRDFLEKHVDEDRFLDFVSRRSPALKGRALPRSKREAIDLMLQQPNLIKRPIVVKGRRVGFGFDKDAIKRLA